MILPNGGPLAPVESRGHGEITYLPPSMWRHVIPTPTTAILQRLETFWTSFNCVDQIAALLCGVNQQRRYAGAWTTQGRYLVAQSAGKNHTAALSPGVGEEGRMFFDKVFTAPGLEASYRLQLAKYGPSLCRSTHGEKSDCPKTKIRLYRSYWRTQSSRLHKQSHKRGTHYQCCAVFVRGFVELSLMAYTCMI